MEQEIIDADDKQKTRKGSVIERTILFYNSICLISTLIYWIYFESVNQHQVTPTHFKFRRFIFENYIREIIILSLSLGILYALFNAFIHKKYILLLVSSAVLTIVLFLFGQLQISEGA